MDEFFNLKSELKGEEKFINQSQFRREQSVD